MALVYPLDFIGSPVLTPPHAGLVAIYGLFEPQSDDLRYIGKTTSPPQRYQMHLRSARAFKRTYVICWLRGLYEQGLKPVMRVLTWVDRAEWSEAERAYIAEGKRLGLRLTNLHPGGRGNNGYKARPEVRAQCSEIQRRLVQQRPDIVRKRVASTKRTYAEDPAREQRRHESLRRAYADPAVRKRVAEAVNKHIAEHPDYLQHVSEGVRRAYDRPGVRGRHRDAQRRVRERQRQERLALEARGNVPPKSTQSAETKAKRSATLKALFAQPAMKRKLSETHKGPHSAAHKAAISEAHLARHAARREAGLEPPKRERLTRSEAQLARHARRRATAQDMRTAGDRAIRDTPEPASAAAYVQLRLPGT